MLSENPVPLWKSAPFLRLVLPLIAGIGFQISCPFQHPFLPLIVFFISFITLLLFHHLHVALKFRLVWVSGACINCLLFATGVLLTWQHTLPNQPGWYGHHFPDSSYALVTIEEPLVEKPKSFKATAAVEQIIRGNSVEKVTGKVLLYFAKDSAAETLQYGQQVLLPNRFQRVKNSGNPGGFDYEQYCRFRNIFHHAFLASGDWQLMPTTHASTFRQALFQRRENFLRLLEKYIPGRQEAALAEALLLGYRDNIDKDLVQAYANTGVVHIIAISGLHLGLIYGLLLWLLKPLHDHQRRWHYIKPVIIIAALWLFALLTGAAPSVLRSATMFTAVVAGKFFLHRHTSVYNTLAASAFLLLCYNPYFLMEVGFQLSYLAVLGIIIFQRPVYNWYRSRRPLAGKLWQLISVSLAAQVLTFPLCLYYFHQFPTFFLLANLIVVPLAGVILNGSILLLCLSPFEIIARGGGWLLGQIINGMNTTILKINSFPFARIDGFSITPAEMVCIYITVASLAAWWIHKRNGALILSLCAVLMLAVSGLRTRYRVAAQKKIIVYNTAPYTAIDIVDGAHVHFVGDTAIRNNAPLFTFHLQPARALLKARESPPPPAHFWRQGNYLQFYKKRLVLLDSLLPAVNPGGKFQADLLILSKNAAASIPQLMDRFEFQEVIFDASCPPWKIEKWKNDCERLNLRHFSVPHEGAFVLDL